jgi:hypothetical protein
MSERVSSQPTIYQPIPVQSGGSSRFSSRHEGFSSGSSFAPTPVMSGSSGSRFSSSSFGNSNAGGFGGGMSSFPSRQSTRFGSSTMDSGSDLTSYMSESERLARVQAKGVYGSGNSLSGSSLTQSRFDGGDLNSASGGGGADGFARSKSWQSNSKWSSGSQYGDGAKPKSYSMLSTAESEQHNVNGQQTGYKAATTTLDDDGKVSTYSIHTP